MKKILLAICFCLAFPLGLLVASPEAIVSQRAGELARLFATESREPQWMTEVLPEYWHPEGDDSGLPSRYPGFLPSIDRTRGTFLFSSMTIGQVISGTSPWILGGREAVYCVELIYSVVAKVDNLVTIYKSPVRRSEYYVMAMDHADQKWKFLQSFPYRAAFYQIPYFLKAWERILGKGSVQNIPEVSQALLAMVKK